MMKNILHPFLIVTLFSFNCLAQNIVLYPTDDASIDQIGGSISLGGQQSLFVYPWSSIPATRRTAIKFDLCSFYGSTVNSAWLVFNQRHTLGTSRIIDFKRLTKDWSESSVHWNMPWANPGGDFDPTTVGSMTSTWSGVLKKDSVNLTASVQSFLNGTYPNYGWLLKMKSEDATQQFWEYYSKEHPTISERPFLRLSLTKPGPTPPSYSGCTGGNGTATTGVNINSGDKYWYTGTGTLATVNLAGGELVVCGNLTITNLNHNSGNLIIENGGTLTINNSNYMVNGGNILNKGTLNITGTVTVQGHPAHVFNYLPTSVLNVGEKFVLNNSCNFVNNGTATIKELVIQTSVSPSVFSGANSNIYTVVFSNNTSNSMTTTSCERACLSYSTTGRFNNVISSSPLQFLCALPSASTFLPANVGSATLITNCVNCVTAVPLPIELIDFKISKKNNSVLIEWQTRSEKNNAFFTVERSKNLVDWQEVSKMDGAGNSNMKIDYQVLDHSPVFGISYYRLKQTDYNGEYSYSDIQSISFENINGVSIFPNPAKNIVNIQASTNELENVRVYSILGQDVTKFTQVIDQSGYQLTLNLSKLIDGTYYIKTSSTTNMITVLRND